MLSERQEKILNMLVKEYIDHAEPVSSLHLKKKCGLSISPATVRNELQQLTENGFIVQPHTSAGRVPTNKAYKYFVDKLFGNEAASAQGSGEPKQEMELEDFIVKEIKEAREKIEQEIRLAHDLTKSLTNISSTLRYTKLQSKDHILEILEILGPSRTTYEKNIDLMKELIKKLENF